MTAATSESWPSFTEELNRKAFEQLERLALQLERGQINEAMFDTGIRSVWHCVSGLVEPWIVDIISETKDKLDGSFFDRRMLVKSVGPDLVDYIWISRQLGDGKLKLRSSELSLSKDWDFSDEIIPSKAAKEMQDKVVAAMIEKGYSLAFKGGSL